MYDELVYTGQVNIKERIKAAWKSLGVLWSALNGYIVSGLQVECRQDDQWIDGMKAGVEMGRGARRAYEEIIESYGRALIKAGKILEDGYRGKDPLHPNFRPAWEAYTIIKDLIESDNSNEMPMGCERQEEQPPNA